MRIIHVIGRSGSGKTTFILQLAGELQKKGRIATIKHLGHHTYTLEPGKDTTLHYSTGAFASAGIDGEKTVLTIRTSDLGHAIGVLGDLGIEYLIIEGYKSVVLPSIVLGDLESPRAVLRNPRPDEVIRSLDLFPEYFTQQGLLKQLIRDLPHNGYYTYLTCAIPNSEPDSHAKFPSVPGHEAIVPSSFFCRIPGLAGIRTYCNPALPGSLEPCIVVAVAFHDPMNASEILSRMELDFKGAMPADIRIFSGA
jgi:molybdopterin-guanine dinucleotide biosynthesis protein B